MRFNDLFLACVLIGSAGVVLSPAAQSAEATAPLPAPQINVRSGVHPGFDRLVFDWPRSVSYQLHRNNSEVTLVFSADAQPRFEKNIVSKLSRVSDVASSTDASGHLTIRFKVDARAVLKDFISDKSVVVDIQGADVPALAPTTPSASEAPPAVGPAADHAPAAAAEPAPAVIVSPASDKTPGETAAATRNDPSSSPVVVVPTITTKQKDRSAAVVAPSPGTAPASTGRLPDLANADLTDKPLLVASLDPHAPTRAAIYQRGGYGYIIFDRKLTFSVADITAGLPTPRIHLEPLSMAKASGYRFALFPDLDLRSTLSGTVWQIYLSRAAPDIPVSASLVAQPNFALGSRFLLPLPDAPEPVHINDPVIGDELIVVPLAQTEAFSVIRYMADFVILPAAQGLVLRPLIDNMIVHAVSDGIEITTEGGLHLSSALDTGAGQQSSKKADAAAAGKSIFDFATWHGKADEPFTLTRQRLQQIIVDVPEADRNRARLELARFYFAHGYGEEASALLAWIARDIPDIMSHADFLALSGASKVLSYRPDAGMTDLGSPLLAGQPEIELWQAVAYAQLRDWPKAEELFAVSQNQLSSYPEPFYSRFSVLAIESAVAAGKDHEAAAWLDRFSNSPHRDNVGPALQYLQGVMETKAGHAAAAEADWKQVAASGDHLYRVRASLALVDLGVSTGSLTPAQAADRLEALRFAWRGDDLELDILHRLGSFYIQAKNVKAGLMVLSQAVQLYPNSFLTPQIRSEMAADFHDVFLADLGKDLTPLDALTIYQQYRILMPTGKEGDAVIRNLSERLVAIDLLDQASTLLDDLARNRLQGAERAQTASRLAAIRLLDHKPDQALDALTIADNMMLPESVQSERRLLRARALSELHRDDEAMALLQNDNHSSAKLLRADLLMHGQHWVDAAHALLDLVGPPPESGIPLTHYEAEWLLNSAIAYSLASDQVGLDHLAIDYGAAMAGTPENDSFRILTQSDKATQLRDISAAQAKLSEVDLFQDYLNSYRKKASDKSAAPAPTPNAAP